MRVQEEGADRLVVTHDDTGWTRCCAYAAIAFVLWALFNYWKIPPDDEKVVASIGAAVTLGGIFLVGYERSVFTFDRRRRMISWTRRRALSRKQGELSFGMVKAVIAMTSGRMDPEPLDPIFSLFTRRGFPGMVLSTLSVAAAILQLGSHYGDC